jgi:hypothetical protein
MELTETPKILHLSLVAGGALRDSDGQRLGRVDDLIVRLGGTGYPPITGLLVTVARRRAYLPSERVASLASGEAVLSKAKLDLRPFPADPRSRPSPAQWILPEMRSLTNSITCINEMSPC